MSTFVLAVAAGAVSAGFFIYGFYVGREAGESRVWWREANRRDRQARAAADGSPEHSTDGTYVPCGRLMIGSGGDTYDPVCDLAEGHSGSCRSTAAVDQFKLAEYPAGHPEAKR